MDKKLKEDIATEYLPEYIQAEKQKRTGFWKAFDDFSGKVEKLCSKVNIEPWGISLACAFLCLGASIPLATAAVGLWSAAAAVEIYSNSVATRAAKKEVQKDIDNGVLPARYQSILASRIVAANQQLETYTALKSQLPKPGEVSAAFTGAVIAKSPPAPENVGAAPKQPALNH